MENNVKGTRQDVRNYSQYDWYCGDNYQYCCHDNQYIANCEEKQTLKKQPPHATVGCFFNNNYNQGEPFVIGNTSLRFNCNVMVLVCQ